MFVTSKWPTFVLVSLTLVALMPTAARPAVAANPNTTAWIPDQRVSTDAVNDDRRPSIATGKHNYLYVAYEHYNPATTKYEIKVAKSTDGGTSWLIIHTKSLSDYNLYMPSIAADPSEDYLYVVYEREYSSSDYDIWLDRYVGGTWYTEYVDNDLDDDHFPSITVEYDKHTNTPYSSINWVYIVYEERVSSSDIDLMFARSEDHGDTWSLSTLWDTDYVVHQPSITYVGYGLVGIPHTVDSYLFVAYRVVNPNYPPPLRGWIDVRRSDDGGYTWDHWHSDISNTDKDCSEPSIAATHGGRVVVLAWTVAYSASDDDVWYSYSIDLGETTYSFAESLATSTANERWPHVTVDGLGRTDNYAGYVHITYSKQETVGSRTNGVYHRTTHFLNPTDWSPAVQIADDDAQVSWYHPTYVDRAITTVRNSVPVVVLTDFGMGAEDGLRGDYDIYATTIGGRFTIDSRPEGLKVRVDGIDYWTPVSFWWAWGSSHLLFAYSPQGSHSFVSWSDGGAQSHTHEASTTAEELTMAYFTPTLTLSLSPTTVAKGSLLTISGQLLPGQTAKIGLYYRVHGTVTWSLGTTMTTNAAGTYSRVATVPMTAPTGSLDLVAAWYDSANNRYSASEIKLLIITP